MLISYAKTYPDLADEFMNCVECQSSDQWSSHIPSEFSADTTASRDSSGMIFHLLARKFPRLFIGTADLAYLNSDQAQGEHRYSKSHIGVGGLSKRLLPRSFLEFWCARACHGGYFKWSGCIRLRLHYSHNVDIPYVL